MLTTDQRAVLRLAAHGLATATIADSLGWSRERVRAETESAWVALGARSKLEAFIIAARHGELGDAS